MLAADKNALERELSVQMLNDILLFQIDDPNENFDACDLLAWRDRLAPYAIAEMDRKRVSGFIA